MLENIYDEKAKEEEEEEWDEENSVFNQQNDVLFDYTYDAKDELFFERDDCRVQIQDALTMNHSHKKVSTFKILSVVWMVLVFGIFIY